MVGVAVHGADHGPVDRLASERQNILTDQGKLFTTWRYHAFITNSTLELPHAERQYRQHAIIEQVNADLKDSALAYMPSGSFAANAAWLTLAAIAHHLTVPPVAWPATGQRYPHTATRHHELDPDPDTFRSSGPPTSGHAGRAAVPSQSWGVS
jgi:hypothetical protein